jgi:hypothetical protein
MRPDVVAWTGRLRYLYQTIGKGRERPGGIPPQRRSSTSLGHACFPWLGLHASVDRSDFDADQIAVHPARRHNGYSEHDRGR